jgi:hypothetical protein
MLHFAPTYASRLNQIGIRFHIFSQDVAEGGAWRSKKELVGQIRLCIRPNRDLTWNIGTKNHGPASQVRGAPACGDSELLGATDLGNRSVLESISLQNHFLESESVSNDMIEAEHIPLPGHIPGVSRKDPP